MSKNLFPYGILILVWILFVLLNMTMNLEISFIGTGILFLLTHLFYHFYLGEVWEKKKYLKETCKTIGILLCLYYLFYFCIGIIVGYKLIPDHSGWTNGLLLGNFILLELLRDRFVKRKGNIKFLTILFACLSFTNIYFFFSLKSVETIFIVFLISLIESFFLTDVAVLVGRIPTILYRILILSPILIFPVIPDFHSFIIGLIFILALLFLWIQLKKYNSDHKKWISKIRSTKDHDLIFIPIILMLIMIFLLTTGTLDYQLYAIASNSMKPEFQRGDIVFFERIKDENVKKIKVGDIVVYKTEERMIVHRVVEKRYENGKNIFITKGDYNDQVDEKSVMESDIVGVVKTHISYLGYPTVWVNELIKGV